MTNEHLSTKLMGNYFTGIDNRADKISDFFSNNNNLIDI